MITEILAFGMELKKEELFTGEVPLVFSNFMTKGLEPEDRRYVKV